MEVDLNDPDQFVRGVPHDAFDWLRANEPVFFNPERDGPGFWCLTRYEDIVYASRKWEIFSSAKGTNIDDAHGGYELAMINLDPPKHQRLRAIVGHGFVPRRIEALEPHVREITKTILDQVAPKGECDFVTEVAAELPLQVICELIGVPHEDRHKIFEWSNTMIGLGDPEYATTLEIATQAAMEMWAYASALAEKRRQEPKDDLVSVLMDAEVDGEKLTEMEFDFFFLLLAIAGNETTRNLISGGMLALMERPDERARLQRDPSLIPSAVEEMLRWVTPVMHFRRTATQDVELHGKTIKEGDKVLLWYVAGNRDPEVFDEPHRFDVARTPNPHITFGAGGPHFCLGFSLAQLEIKVMFEDILRRMPDIEPNGEVARLRSNFINGIKHMPVRFTPEAL